MFKKIVTLAAISVLTIGAISGCSRDVAPPVSAEKAETPSSDWREDYAYSMGVAAMHYAYPFWRMAHVRYDWTMKELESPASLVVPNQANNQFWHATVLTNADWKEGGAPNNDALYSIAWVHVKDEPMVLSLPPIDRYFTFELSGMDSDNFAYISELTYGRDGGDFALLPKGWKGELPEGVTAVAEVPSPWILVGGRTYVGSEEDLPLVHEIQKNYRLTPLSQLGQESVAMPQPEILKPFDNSHAVIDDPMAVWKTINHVLTENPPSAYEASLMSFFRELNVGPGLDLDTLDESSKRGLARAAVDGFEQIKRAQIVGAGEAVIHSNGWTYSREYGRAGAGGDFFVRSVHQSYTGIVANDAEEAIYYGGYVGDDGQPLHGSKNYRIHLPAGADPDVSAFWSITMYGTDTNYVDNEINRYSIGDRTKGLVRDADGGLTITIQAEPPADADANWLPAPQEAFWIVLRAYQPGESLLKGEWTLPLVSVVDPEVTIAD